MNKHPNIMEGTRKEISVFFHDSFYTGGENHENHASSTEWSNGEGIDFTVGNKSVISLTYEEIDALIKSYNLLIGKEGYTTPKGKTKIKWQCNKCKQKHIYKYDIDQCGMLELNGIIMECSDCGHKQKSIPTSIKLIACKNIKE